MKTTSKPIPKLRFKEFKSADPWEVKRLGELGQFYSSLTGKTKKDFGYGNSNYITYKNVFSNYFIDIKMVEKVNILPEENQTKVKYGDIFFTMSSETPEEVGISSILLDILENTYLNSFCSLFRLDNTSEHNLIFLGYILRANFIRDIITKKAQGSTRFNLSKIVLKTLPIPFPTLAEQEKIAAVLSSMDRLLELENQKLQHLEQHKKGLLQKLFPKEGESVPGLRFKEFESADPWEVKTLGEVLEQQSIKNKSQEDLTVLSVSNSLGFISQMEQFENREVASKDKSNYKVVLKNDYAYNPSRINVGSIARLINFEKGIVSPMYIVFRLKGVENSFFDQLLNTFLFKELVKANLSGGVRDSLSFDALITFSIPLPALAEQEKIAAVLSSADQNITQQKQNIQALKLHKKYLLQNLFPQEVE